MSPDRSLIATGAGDGSLRVFDVATGRLEHELTFPGQGVDGVAFLDDRRIGVLLADEGNLRVLTLDRTELLGIVRQSLTRGLTAAECDRFGFDRCPTLAAMRGD